jgi:hypothetical protein
LDDVLDIRLMSAFPPESGRRSAFWVRCLIAGYSSTIFST